MTERQPNDHPKTPEQKLRDTIEHKLSVDDTRLAGVWACKAVVGDRDYWVSGDLGKPKTRFDLTALYDYKGDTQSYNIATYRPNVPRFDVSATGEITEHEEEPVGTFSLQVDPEYDIPNKLSQYGSDVPLNADIVSALDRDIRVTKPIRGLEYRDSEFYREHPQSPPR